MHVPSTSSTCSTVSRVGLLSSSAMPAWRSRYEGMLATMAEHVQKSFLPEGVKGSDVC